MGLGVLAPSDPDPGRAGNLGSLLEEVRTPDPGLSGKEVPHTWGSRAGHRADKGLPSPGAPSTPPRPEMVAEALTGTSGGLPRFHSRRSSGAASPLPTPPPPAEGSPSFVAQPPRGKHSPGLRDAAFFYIRMKCHDRSLQRPPCPVESEPRREGEGSGEPAHGPQAQAAPGRSSVAASGCRAQQGGTPINPAATGAQGCVAASLEDKLKRMKITSPASPHPGQECGAGQGLNLQTVIWASPGKSSRSAQPQSLISLLPSLAPPLAFTWPTSLSLPPTPNASHRCHHHQFQHSFTMSL